MKEPKEILAGFSRPFYAAANPEGKLYVCDFTGGSVTSRDDHFSMSGFRGPHSIDWDANGVPYVCEYYGGRICKLRRGEYGLTSADDFLTGLAGPATAFFNPEKTRLYVTDFTSSTVKIYDLKGELVGALPGTFNKPHGVTFDDVGNVYVADTHHHRITKFNSSGIEQISFGMSRLNQPVSIAYYEGHLYTSEYCSDEVKQWTLDGKFEDIICSGLTHPYGISIDKDGTLYVADSDAGCIKLFDLRAELPKADD